MLTWLIIEHRPTGYGKVVDTVLAERPAAIRQMGRYDPMRYSYVPLAEIDRVCVVLASTTTPRSNFNERKLSTQRSH